MTTYAEQQQLLLDSFYLEYPDRNRRAQDLVEAGIGLTDAARAELVWWFRQEWQLTGAKYNRWRRRDLFQACLVAGEIDAAGIAEASTGDTWLHVLCAGVTTTKEIEALLNAGAMTVINAANANGDTPLHAYMLRSYHSRGSQPNKKGLRRLLESGADPALRNNAGQTPADVTRERKFVRHDAVKAQREMLEVLDAAAPRPCA